jgi:4,5-dihydroxyphthalate decarboxylase
MPQPKIRFFFREPTVDTNRPLNDGLVKVEGFVFETVATLEEADAWDCGFAARMLSHAAGEGDVSIPAFPNRKFRQSYIYVNAKAGIAVPRDLEGKRVAILMWANTAGIWARGALQHAYGVDLRRIRWVVRHQADMAPPPGMTAEPLIGGSVDDLLLSGALDAVIDPNVLPSITRRDPRVRRLFPDYKAAEQAYFRQTGIFPISHVVTLRGPFVARHPDAPVALLKAFRRARDMALDNIQGADPQVLVVSWVNALLDEQRALMGDNHFAYNIADNRVTLAAMMRYSLDQGLISQPAEFASLFSPAAAQLAGA